MTDRDLTLALPTMLRRLREVRMVETPPLPNYLADARARQACYRTAHRAGVRVTTNVVPVPGRPGMSVLRVRLVEDAA